jgi:hypothetical protein
MTELALGLFALVTSGATVYLTTRLYAEERNKDREMLKMLFSEALLHAKATDVNQAVQASSIDRQLRNIEAAEVARVAAPLPTKRNETDEERLVREIEETGTSGDKKWEAL